MQAARTLYADEMPVPGTGLTDVDIYLFRRFYEEHFDVTIEDLDLPIEKLLSNLKLMKETTLTLAGLLLFAKQPERVKPQYTVKAVAFDGNDVAGNQYLDSEDIGGPMRVVYDSGMGFFKRNLRKKQKGQSFNMPGILEIPQTALEEALVNALIHRDYFIDSGVRLFVFDNRVEIISPGKLPNTVTTENIKHGIQMVRNPILLSFVNKLGIPYRGIGSGILRMIKECRNYGIPAPEFVEDKNAELFKVEFTREGVS
jgi:predicted HTH transcriptional regulator